MEYKEHRRKHKRFPVRWKAAVVFDRATERPILHTETFDLSYGGGAIMTNYGDLTGSMITLLLAQPPTQAGDQPKMIKVQAKVVSSAQAPGKSGYRHGICFIRSPAEDLERFEELLACATSPAASVTPSAATMPTPTAQSAVTAATEQATPAQAAPLGRLATLKQAAQAKLAEEAAKPKSETKEQREERVSESLKRAYWYFKDMVEQLDVLKPDYPNKGYAINGVPEFTDFAWDIGKLDLITRETSPITKLFTHFTLDFRLSKQRPMLKVEREHAGTEKLKQILKDYGLAFHISDTRNDRGAIVKTTFSFPCEVLAKIELIGKFDAGNLILKMSNVGQFGKLEYTIEPAAVTQESLEELTGFILGEERQVGPLILKRA